METDAEYEQYIKMMEQFPCAFNLLITRVTTAKLQTMKHNLDSELDIADESDGERIIKLNLLTWVRFCLQDLMKALKLNNDIVDSAKWKNVASLGNRFFMMWQMGDKDDAVVCLKHLEKMKSEADFDTLLTEATAEQAYYYSRLGTPYSLRCAIDLFCDLPETPVNYLRKFGLGLVYRRATRAKMSDSSATVEDYQRMAAECLFEVAEKADTRLSSLAYAQLAGLQRSHPKRRHREHEALFRGLSVDKLCVKALEHGANIPSVLTQCGIAMRPIDIDKSIEWLRKSVTIKRNSPAYHHLGISYKQKAEQVASDEGNQGTASGSCETAGPSRHARGISTESITPDCQRNYHRRKSSDDNRQSKYNNEDTNDQNSEVNNEHHDLDDQYSEVDNEHHDLDDEYGEVNNEHQDLDVEYGPRYDDSRNKRNTLTKRSYPAAGTSETTKAKLARFQECEYADNDNEEETHTVLIRRSKSDFGSRYSETHANTNSGWGSRYRETHANTNSGWGSGYSETLVNTNSDSESGYPETHVNTNVCQDIATYEGKLHYRNQSYSDPRKNIFTTSRSHDVDEYRYRQKRGYQKNTAWRWNTHRKRGSRWNDRNTRGSQWNYRRTSGDWDNRNNRGARWSDRSRRYNVSLNKDDENVKEAVRCFQEAIDIAKENFSAAIDLGVLLKETNQINDALKQFDSITNSYDPSFSHKQTVICAYEQAGLCYLQLSQTEGSNDNEKIWKIKLTQAISLAASLVHIMPELQNSLKDVWLTLKSLVTGKEHIYYPIHMKRNILQLVKDYRKDIKVIHQLKDIGEGGLDDYVSIKGVLNNHLEIDQPETALAFQNLVALNPDVKTADWWNSNDMLTIRIKVMLRAVSRRLSEISENPTMLFQQLFELVFGGCFGLCDPESDQQSDRECGVLGDVLFVFDTDDSPDEENIYPTVKSARCLKKLSACLFGLEVEENLKGCLTYHDSVREIQLRRMKEYQVVIIVLGNEERDKEFDAVLKCVKKDPTDPPKHKILIIDAGIGDKQVPKSLKQYDRIKLEDIGGLGDINLCPDIGDTTDRLSYADILTHVCRGNVDSVMKLFCFMIGQTFSPK